MVPLRFEHGLLFTTVSLTFGGSTLVLPNAIVDTGSAGTVFSISIVEQIGIIAELTDEIRTLRGIGGHELVIIKRVDIVSLGTLSVQNFEIEVGAMDYGVSMDAIIGLDFLLRTQARIDLAAMTIGARRRTKA